MSILSALLTQDQVVTPRKIDEAIQRQVISGGDFETNLLEVGAIAEDCLAGYSAVAQKMIPATRAEVLTADAALIARVPRHLAERAGVLPLRVEGDAVLVATATPISDDARRALESVLGRRVEPRLVTAVRVAAALAEHYNLAIPARMKRLAERLSKQPPGQLPARASRPPALSSAAETARAMGALAALEAALKDDDEVPARTPSIPAPPRSAPTTPPPSRRPDDARRTIRIGDPRRPSPPDPPSTRPLPPVRTTEELISLRAARVPDTRELLSGQRPLDLAEARRILAEAADRETVIDALLDHTAQSFEYVALFALHGDEVAGLGSRGDGLTGGPLRALRIPLAQCEAFTRARAAEAAVVAPLADGDLALRERLLRRAASVAVAAPLKLRGKVALLVWADRGATPPDGASVEALGAFLDECAGAFTRLILSRKRASQPPAAGSAPSTLDPLRSVAPRGERRSSIPSVEARMAALRAAVLTDERRPSASPRRSRSEGRLSVPPTIPVDRNAATKLLDEVVKGGASGDAAATELVSLGERSLDAVFQRFPGPHSIVRADVGAKLPLASSSGPVLRVVVALRHLAASRLLAALADPDPDRRFCAMLCFAEIVYPAAIPHLTPLLTDPDYPTRMAAVEVLRGYRRLPEFAAVGVALRAVIRDARASADVRRAAAHAAGELRDSESVTALIATLSERDPSLIAAAHRALVVLARQDFGNDPARWVEWWDKASSKHRVEWLIEALTHADATVRHEAGEELKAITGQFFGYYFNLPRKERERAQQRYLEWWRREGAQRVTLRPQPDR